METNTAFEMNRGTALIKGLGAVHLGLAAALLLTAASLSGCDSEAAPIVETIRPVKAEVVRYEGAAASFSYPGTVQPRHENVMAFRVAGRITERLVDAGEEVAPGTVVAVLDKTDLELQRRTAQAQLTSAQADAAQARIDLDRYTRIKGSPGFSQAVYDQRGSALAVAEARVNQAESQLKLSENQLSYATLTADQFGVVTAVNAEAGQVVAAGQGVVTIARSGGMEVEVNIPENRLPELKDSAAHVTLWSQPGEVLPARLREVAASADPATRTYAVRFVLDELPEDLQIGMSATVNLSRQDSGQVAEVPLAAVFQNGEQPTVWVVDPITGSLTRTPVTVAAFRSTTALLAGGVKDGDVIVAAGAHKLNETQRVRVLAPQI